MSSLLLDIGGSFIKAGVLDKNHVRISDVEQFQTPTLLRNTRTNRFEIDISELKSKVLSIVSSKIRRFPSIEDIYVSGQMGCWSLEGLPSLHNKLVSWQDRRMLERFESVETLIDSYGLKTHLTLNGNEMNIGSPIAGMFSMLSEISRGSSSVRFQSLISMVVSILTNNTHSRMHITDAASTGFVDLSSQSWNMEILENFFSNVKMPEICVDIEFVGEFQNTGSKVYSGVGDQQASLLGVGLAPFNVVVNIGTGGQVASFHRAAVNAGIKVRPYFAGQTFNTITHLPSGRFLNKLVKTVSENLFEEFTFDALNNFEFSEKNFLMQFDPQFELDDIYHKNFFIMCGKQHYIENCLSYMAFQYMRAIETLKIDSSCKIIFAGGVGQKNRAITGLIMRLLDSNLFEISGEVETTLAGLKILANNQSSSLNGFNY